MVMHVGESVLPGQVHHELHIGRHNTMSCF
jgi:hypothetical protein